MPTLVAFGCSFTDYGWPTWSDIIALDQPTWRYENWAVSGAGNQMIARRLLYRDCWLGRSPDDIICIQWSSIFREDRFQQGQWHGLGSVFNSPHYGLDYAEKYWDIDNDTINTAQAKLTANSLFGNRIQYQMEINDSVYNYINAEETTKLTEFWQQHLTQYDLIGSGPFLEGYTKDRHPDPEYWLTWVEQRIYPKLKLKMKQSTRARVYEYQKWLVDLARTGIDHSKLTALSAERMKDEAWPMNKCKPESNHPYLKEQIILM